MSTLYTDISPFCCAVLEARVRDGSLPAGDVWCRDVRTLTADEIRRFRHVHLFCGIGGSPLGFMWAGWPDGLSTVSGGFPCQDISSAGKAAGLDGERSGLYRECLRVLDIARPDWTKLENVGALSARGLDRLAGEMDEVGYPIHALRLGAWAVGSAQQRERWWIVSRREDRGADRRGDVLQGVDELPCGGAVRLSARSGQPGRAEADPAWGSQGGGVGDVRGERARHTNASEREGGVASTRADPRGGVAVAEGDGRGRGVAVAGRRSPERAAADGADQGGGVAHGVCAGRGAGAGESGDQGGARIRRDQSTARGGGGVELADAGGCGHGTVGIGGARAFDDIAGAGGGLVQSAGARLQGHWADAGESQEPEPWHTGACRRTGRTGWVHPLWVNAQTGEPVPTPRYQGEPPRLFAGTRTISAEWRLGLMGFPYGWLDVPADIAAKYALPACPKKRNKLGIEATGNAQVPQCVAVVAAGMLDAEREAANA